MNIVNLLNKIKFVPLHFVFWTFVWLFYVYFFGFNSGNQNYIYWFSSILIPITMLVTYFVIYFLIPKYLLKRKYKLFILYGIYSIVGVSYLVVWVMLGGFVFMTKSDIGKIPPLSWSLPYILFSVYLIVFVVSTFKLLKFNYESLEKNKSLENKILETQLQIKNQELHFLKKQIHPHFLFNTLNTIYGFALKQSKDTPEIILKLSNLLDYILYQVNKPKVFLKEEVLHIQEYIELEKIRFQDTLKVNFKSNIINGDIQVAPMLLIPFVENAFKHGNIVNGFLKVEVEIYLKGNQLDFSIKNTVLNNDDSESENGIGLENIQKRLDLLYKDNYDLKIERKDNWFIVNLKLDNLNA